jgi:hypothetical protein
MRLMRAAASTLVVPVALLAVLCLGVDPVEGQALLQQRTVYSAKFLCGEYRPDPALLREGPVKPGNYQTAINIVNPTRTPFAFVKKAVLLFDSFDPAFFNSPPETPRPPGQRFQVFLEENWGLEIDCDDIRTVLVGRPVPPGTPAPFLKGFVVLETFQAGHILDVVAAYTSHTFTVDEAGNLIAEGFATDVDKVPGTRVP